MDDLESLKSENERLKKVVCEMASLVLQANTILEKAMELISEKGID